MVERSTTRLWLMRGLFFSLSGALIFWRLLPLDTLPDGFAGPDLMVALACAWVLRRPEFAPPLLIGGMILLADFLFQRPPGLFAALVVVATEALKARAPGLRDMTFPPEWLTVAMAMTAVWLVYRIVLAALLVDQAPLGLSALQLFMTVIIYPAVVLLCSSALGVRKIRPGDAESLGVRT